jgi:hypothetical protein
VKPQTPVPLDVHRREFERALRQALSTSQPALRRQALEEAARHLVHPKLMLESPLLDDTHPWKQHALIVSDAFEAITNGMEEPDLFEALEHWESGSPFEPWRELILALRAFYRGDDPEAARRASAVSGGPAAALARVVLALAGRSGRGLTAAEAQLAEAIARPDPMTEQWIQDVTEGLETDDEPLFWDAFAAWLDLAAPEAPEEARSAVLWAWAQLEWRDFDEQVLLDLSAVHWGRAEACRLAALGTASWDAEGASLLWLRFLVAASREGLIDPAQLAEARALLDRFERAAGTLTEEGRATRAVLVRAWNAEAGQRGWPQGRIAEAPAVPVRAAPGAQLDLFA